MEAYPLQWPVGWPRVPKGERVLSRFGSWNNKPTVARATDFLIEQIRLLCGKRYDDEIDFIISSDLRVKLNGLPYSGQKDPEDTGIAVYFVYNGEKKVIACDTFNKIGCNLWAIGKTIEALRGIDRWGCSELMNRAFTGFKALPENGSNIKVPTPWEILGVSSDASKEEIKKSYKALCKVYHPDVCDGDGEYFMIIKEAYEQLIEK